MEALSAARPGAAGLGESEARDRSAQRRLAARQAIALVVALGGLAYLAVDGATYDIVDRQRLGVVVWAVIAFGLIVGLFPRSRPDRALAIPAIAFVALVAWVALSFTWTSSAERTMAELARLVMFGGVAALAMIGLNRYTFRAAAAGISVAAFGVCALAVFSRLNPTAISAASELGALFPTQADRLNYPLDYWNAIGAWGAMTIAIALAWSAHAKRVVTRALTLSVVPLAGLAVYLSYSRGGVLAVGVAVVAVIAISRNRWTAAMHAVLAGAATAVPVLVARSSTQIAEATGDKGAEAVALALLGAAAVCAGAVVITRVLRADDARLSPATALWSVPAAVVVLAIAVVGAGGPAISDVWDEFKSQEQPATGEAGARLTSAGGSRDALWTSANDAFEANAFKGIGPGTYEYWWQSEGGDSEFVRDAHSLYLEQMAELGIVGIALLLAILGGLLYAGVRVMRTLRRRGDVGAAVAMCSCFLVWLVVAGVDWMWEETAVTALGIGAIAVAAAAGSERRERRARQGRLGFRGGRTLAVVGAVLAACTQVPGLVSNERVRDSYAALSEGDVEGARELARDAIEAEPWAATPHRQLALVHEVAGELDASVKEMEEAVSKEPTNWRWPLSLALVQVANGDREDAIETFEKSRHLAPDLGFYSPFGGYGGRIYTPEQLERIFAEQGGSSP